MPVFAFWYQMRNSPEHIRAVVPDHVAYWKNKTFEYYKGGPFADRSGGLIVFSAATIEEAQTHANEDPFVKQSLLEQQVLKEWKME